MAAIPVTIRGVILKKMPKRGDAGPSSEEVVINGLLTIAGLIVDGGPIINPDPVEPPVDGGPPAEGDWIKPPPPEGGWGLHAGPPVTWVYVKIPGAGEPGPK